MQEKIKMGSMWKQSFQAVRLWGNEIMRVLVIDDEPRIRRLLIISLGSKGIEVLESATGYEAIQNIASFKPDVVLLDLNLPDMDGKEVLEKLRSWSNIPVIILSVRNSQEDIVSMLDAGADDYIVKPFYTNEVLARLSAVYRRNSPDFGMRYACGEISIDLETRIILKQGNPIHLTATEYSILEYLTRHAGKIVTKDRLLKEVWGQGWELEEGSLRVHIRALRLKLEADPEKPCFITTDPGVGYRLASPDEQTA
jgi:two-component system KDP operon response regulator KdpE